MKNENEYRIEDRLYIRSVKRCACVEKTGEEYILRCRIHQRGEYPYLYRTGAPYLDKDGKKLWLSAEAAETVMQSIEWFETEITAFAKAEYEVTLAEDVFTLYYRRNDRNTFDLLLRITVNEGERFTLLCELEFRDLVREISFAARRAGLNRIPAIRRIVCSTEETIGGNPLWLHAVNTGDEFTAGQILLYHNLVNEQNRGDLERLLGHRILPKLPKEYDRDYAVISETVDCKLLRDSGYTIRHTPYFAMKGSTHDKWLLNPHNKIGVDAAKIRDEAMTFSEYLELIETALK